MTPERKTLPGHAERLIRALLLLVSSVSFSLIAWGAGAYRVQNQVLVFALVGAVIVAAILISRFGARLIARRLLR